MNISLTPVLERFIQEKVASGRYASASEVVREALRVLEERDRVEETRLRALRDEAVKALNPLSARDGLIDPVVELVPPLEPPHRRSRPRNGAT